LDSTDAGRSYYTEFSEKRAHWQSGMQSALED
jgi:phage-related minor tail protein